MTESLIGYNESSNVANNMRNDRQSEGKRVETKS